MIDQKYLELINRDIDNAISPEEKQVLHDYLKMNPEANIMHQELSEVEKLLDKIPDTDPSDTLKQRILNSIDLNRYSYKKKKSITDYLFVSFSGKRKKLTVSFALGMLSGILLLSLIFYASFYNNFPDSNNVLGTIGLSESQIMESINVNTADITGRIDIINAPNQYAVYVNLKSSMKYILQVQFDQENLKIDNLAGNGHNNMPYSLLFSPKDSSSHKILLTIIRENNSIFEKEINVPDR